jgi:hypothetical protein
MSTFVTTLGATYEAVSVSTAEAVSVGCLDATHKLVGRVGVQYARWVPATGRPVRSVPVNGWRNRTGVRGEFRSWWNADAETGCPGYLLGPANT